MDGLAELGEFVVHLLPGSLDRPLGGVDRVAQESAGAPDVAGAGPVGELEAPRFEELSDVLIEFVLADGFHSMLGCVHAK
jgi:hypothetical protein